MASETSPDNISYLPGTKDGEGSADNDQTFKFGRRPTPDAPFPFTIMQFTKIVIYKSGLKDGQKGTHSHLKIWKEKADGK